MPHRLAAPHPVGRSAGCLRQFPTFLGHSRSYDCTAVSHASNARTMLPWLATMATASPWTQTVDSPAAGDPVVGFLLCERPQALLRDERGRRLGVIQG